MAKRKRRKCDGDAALNSRDISLKNECQTRAESGARSRFKFDELRYLSKSKIRCILLVFSGLIYLNSLKCGFVYDDRRAILENRDVVQPGNWMQLLTDDFWGTPVMHKGSHKSYRPLVTLTYKLQAQLDNYLYNYVHPTSSSQVSPQDAPIHQTDAQPMDAAWFKTSSTAFSYHFVNLLLHLCVVSLVFELSGALLSLDNQREQNRSKLAADSAKASAGSSNQPDATKLLACISSKRNRRRKRLQTTDAVRFQAVIENDDYVDDNNNNNGTALGSFDANNSNQQQPCNYIIKASIAAFLFASHPIHVEAVTSLVGRAELMGSLFGLLSFRSMIKRLDGLESGTIHSSSTGHLFRAACFAFLACLSKENSSTVILINIILVIWSASKSAKGRSPDWTSMLTMIMLTVVYALLRVALMYTNVEKESIQSGFLPKFSQNDNPLALSAEDFCLTYQNLLKDLKPEEESSAFCGNQAILKQVQYRMLLTRLYLPFFNLKLLTNPTELSYDWPLISIGLVKSITETRFMLAVGVYMLLIWYLTPFIYLFGSTVLSELLVLFKGRDCGLRHLSRSASKKAASVEKEDEEEAEEAVISQQRDNPTPDSGYCDSVTSDKSALCHEDDPAGSSGDEASSVSSLDTSKSNDSGFADARCNAAASSSSLDSAQSVLHEENGERLPAEVAGSVFDVEQGRSLSSYQFAAAAAAIGPQHSTLPDKRQEGLVSQAGSCSTLQDETPNGYLNNKNDRIFWSIVWLVIPFVPSSNALVSVGFLVAERTLYLPSFGLCLLVAHLVDEVLLKSMYDDPKNGYWLSCKLLVSSRCQLKPQQQNGSAPKRTRFTSSAGKTKVSQLQKQAKSDQNRAIKLGSALILPLIILGALKTIQRNADWLDEQSLYNSNLLQSPAKSMANLASIGHQNYDNVDLYRKALDLEPNSADLHYNLALVLHRKLHTVSGATIDPRKGSTSTSQIEYHYRTALRLRANFPMAALSLGAYQWMYLRQLDGAEQTFVQCAYGMDPRASKTYSAFVQTQIECLISAAKLYTTRRKNAIKTTSIDTSQTAAVVADTIEDDADADDDGTSQLEQTTNAIVDDAKQTTNRRKENESCPARVLKWMRFARTKALQIEDDATSSMQSQSPKSIGDLNKQLASINWIEAICLQQERGATRKLDLFADAVERFAWSSLSPIDPSIYIDYTQALLSQGFVERGVNVLRRSFDIELVKRSQTDSLRDLCRLLRYLAELKPEVAFEASQRLLSSIRKGSHPIGSDLLTMLAEIAFEAKRYEASEEYYEAALREISNQQAPKTRLASAHVNFGAILQVNGKLSEAREQYEIAVGCDENNGNAQKNLAAILKKLSST